MALTPEQKKGWLAIGALLLGAFALGAMSSSTDHEAEEEDDEGDEDGDQDEVLPPGRAFELALVDVIERSHRGRVLDNPRVEADDGRLMKPDVVVLERSRAAVREVREAKDVGLLQETHVWQAARYDAELAPNRGTTIDIPDRTFVPREVDTLARGLGIAIQRWRV